MTHPTQMTVRGFGLLNRVRSIQALDPFDIRCTWQRRHISLTGSRGRVALFSTSQAASSSAAAPVYTPVPHRAILSLKGRDTFKLLQGLVSNDVSKMEKISQSGGGSSAGFSVYAGLMNPQGRMLADLFLHLSPATLSSSSTTDPEVLLEHDTRITTPLLAFIKRFKLRSKVKLEDVSARWHVGQMFVPGSTALDGASQGGSKVLDELAASRTGAIVLRDVRSPNMGFRILSDRESEQGMQGAEKADEAAYTIHRILQGVPEGSEDINMEHALPLEINLDYMGGVDFRKGCYVGQELTARTHHTGVVRKRVIPVSLYNLGAEPPSALSVDKSFSTPLPPPGTDVRSTPITTSIPSSTEAPTAASPAKPARGRSAGKFSSGIHNIGLACLRLEQVERWAALAEGESRSDGLMMSMQLPGEEGKMLGVRPWIPASWPAKAGEVVEG